MKFFALVVAISVAVVAWLQWWVALNKLRLDLFHRRYRVYEATRKFLAAILEGIWANVTHVLLSCHSLMSFQASEKLLPVPLFASAALCR